MTDAATPVDMEAAAKAVLAGKSLAGHLGLSDQMAHALYAEAVGHHEAGRHAQALECLRQVVGLDAHSADAWALMGNTLMREGQFAQALEAWCLALHLNPSFAAAQQVARTALALKDAPSASLGIIAMFKHATTAEQHAAGIQLGQALQALSAEGAAPAAPS